MRVLGFDPGFARLGFGAVSMVDGELSLITHGLIQNPREATQTFNAYLNAGILQITNDLPRLIDVVKPDVICAETVPPGRLSANSELVVAAITTCKVIAFQFGIEWIDYGANTIKKTVAGDGTASKAKIKNAVIAEFPIIGERHKLLKVEQKAGGEKATGLPADVFDGVAVAMTGAHLIMEKNDRRQYDGKDKGLSDVQEA